ncbi:CCGSCS motif protein [Ferrimonas lipolytica]|uniref:CCGSCS motif protein n=1 Tax=Ferrimonas lipolytica TaxID=2724191 RepID=A0A6H1UAM4_9GAMM|nr:CCGSCS motif protein [Ferrimonas lipolytica]QIZ76101.1 CCGSCS motif protein [Ferrimonas lipolytica]
MALSFTKIFKKSQDKEAAAQRESVLVAPVKQQSPAKANNEAEQEKPVSCCGHCS